MRYNYKFFKIGKYEVWKNWYKKGFHIRNRKTRIFGFNTRNEAEEFINLILEY